ncbi:hypothetical protein BHE74_00012660, partial [Ensete ventricosum]
MPLDQGFPYQSVPPIPGRPVCKPLTTGQYRQNRLSAVDFAHRWSIEGEKGKKKKKKKKKKRRNKRRRRIPRAVLARAPSRPASDFSPAQGERSRR